MEPPLLTICIPTYNRPDYLRRALLSIMESLENDEARQKVEVVVTDDRGDERTFGVVEECQKQFPGIHYFANEQRLKFDGNALNSVLLATGSFCWYFGDDDLIALGALPAILQYLSSHPVSVLTLVGQTFSEYSELNGKSFVYADDDFIVSKSFDEFVPYCRGLFSTFIFFRELWMQTDRTNYEPGWSYFEIIFRMLPKAKQPLVHLARPALFLKDDCAWATGGAELFTFLGWKRIVEKLPSLGYDSKKIEVILKDFPKDLLITLVRAKGNGLPKRPDILKTIFKDFKGYTILLVSVALVFYVPNFLVQIVKYFKKAL